MGSKTTAPPFLTALSTRPVSALLLLSFLWFLLHHLPSPPATENNTRADRPAPVHRVEAQPRFLYRSPFRQYPDVGYEHWLANALGDIERAVLAHNHGNNIAEDRIWQIGLGQKHESSDSTAFKQQNSEWAYTLVTREKAIEFLTNELAAIPDIANIFQSFPHNVLRADLLRYLLLWYYGGYYADVDVFPARSIKTCPALEPLLYGTAGDIDTDVSLVVGVEIDEPYASPQFMRDWHWARSHGFIQYTMYAPRRFSPLLRKTIIHVLSHAKQYESQGNLLHGPKYDEKAILEITGPGVFTDAVLETLSASLPAKHPLVQKSTSADLETDDLISPVTGEREQRVTWAPFHRLRDTVCIGASEGIPERPMGGLCVLPISVWGNGQRHSQAGGFNSPNACVNHRFGRTWKKGWWEYIFG